MNMNYHIWTIGCQMNEADSRLLAGRLETLGYRSTPHVTEADLVVLNTCVVRQQAEDKVYGKLHHLRALKQRNPRLRIALMGCLVGTHEADRLRERFDFVDVFLPPSDSDPLFSQLVPPEDIGTGEAALLLSSEDEYRLPQGDSAAVTAHVPVVLGCSHACTYCVIPYRRGRERSRPREDILHEVRRLADQGVREVVLLGQIIDRYGLDRPGAGGLGDLLPSVADVPGILRVRFLTNHPNYLDPAILDAVAGHPGLCPHFELPFQSGSDAILEQMRRGYTRRQYIALVDRIRARLPEAAIHTDIIVGFPGETEAQFGETLSLLEMLRLDKAHIARYSPRPQTYAARRLPDDVPEAEKERRRKALDDVQLRIMAAKNEAYRGRIVEVLVSGRDDKRGRWRGRTPDDRLVFFEDPRDLPGRVVPVRIEHTSPFSLRGTPAGPGNGAAPAR